MILQKLVRTGRCCTTLVLVVVVGPVSAFGAAPIQPTQPPAHRSVVNPPLVHVTEGLLTVEADEASLKELLEEIARRSGFTLQGQGAISKRITIQLEEVRLDVGLQRVLEGYRYGLQYPAGRRAGQPADVPKHLEIFGVVEGTLGDARERQPVSDDALREIDRLRTVLVNAEDAALREAAVEELMDSQYPTLALPLLSVPLADPDENVRLAAIDALQVLGVGALAVDAVALLQVSLRDQAAFIREAGIAAVEGIGLDTGAASHAVETLAIALTDVDADLREQAIEALWEIGGSRAIELLEYASAADSDPSIRDVATDRLEQLRGGAR